MAGSVCGQDEPKHTQWFTTLAGKMELSCPLWTTCHVSREKFPQKPYNKSFIDQAFSVKMTGYWPHPFFAGLWTSILSESINMQKKNLANIQPSWPHAWSITHISSPDISYEPTLLWSRRFFLIFLRMRKLRNCEHESQSNKKIYEYFFTLNPMYTSYHTYQHLII